MKNVIVLSALATSLLSCDPVSDLEANIENVTAQPIRVEFVSTVEGESKTLQIAPNEIKLFQEGFDIGSTYLEPSLTQYDSVVVRNENNHVLKVFKETTAGKNIYTIRDWISSEPSKRFFLYEFEIQNQDIQ